MVLRSMAIASMLSGMFATNADAGTFGNRHNRCQAAPVVCNPCAPVVCNRVVCNPPNGVQCPPSQGMGPAQHEGPAFPGRSAEAPLGRDSQGDIVTQVFPPFSAEPASASSFDVERFLEDLLTDRLLAPQGITKNAVINGQIDRNQLNEILENYR